METFNGWESLPVGSPLIHKWIVPETDRHLLIRRGSVGFLLVHNALYFHEEVERLDIGQWDDWGYAPRPPSNHGSATATDLNAVRHPFHVPIHRTFTDKQIKQIRKRLRLYDGIIDWGGNWRDPDGMHFEIAPGTPMAKCERKARQLADSPRGKRILRANPGQFRVIQS